jgi:ketosteroid isomerase-like protein
MLLVVSQENVEVVRRFFAALEHAFEAYWGDPQPIAAAMEAGELPSEWQESWSYLHPEIVWQTVFLRETFRGHLEAARAWDDFLRWAKDYRPHLEEVEELGGDQVYAVVGLVGQGKDSDRRMDARFHDIFTVREGLIVRLEEYTSRSEALGDNVDMLRAFWKSFTPDGHFDMSILDPDVIYEDSNLPDHIGEEYRGHEGIARAAARWAESYESLTVELERIVGHGDRLVSIHHVRSKARYSGIEEEGPVAYTWTFRDGKVIHFRSYRDPAEALEAAQLQG